MARTETCVGEEASDTQLEGKLELIMKVLASKTCCWFGISLNTQRILSRAVL